MKARDRNPRVYLDDIQSAVGRIGKYVADGKRKFLVDTKTQDAVLYQLAIIGEAAAKLPRAMRAAYPEIPWKDIVGMRNIIIHDYSGITIDRIWDAVERDLPTLRRAVRTMLRDLGAAERKREMAGS